jgi:hypothetical protein
MKAKRRTDDPAYRAALEAIALPWPPRSRRALWHDAQLLARAQGAREISVRHLRQALLMQQAITQVIASDPSWRRELARCRRRRAAIDAARHLGA